MAARRVIYDFGANNGDDVSYYLRKADLVVAIEANPALCGDIRSRFAADIDSGRLVVENCAVTADAVVDDECDFYLHRRHHVLGQVPPPAEDRRTEFERITVPCRAATQIIACHGDPHYVKIDVQQSEAKILRSLLEQGIRPPYISAELQGIEVFALLIAIGRYNAFKIVDGDTVPMMYGNCRIATGGQEERHAFPVHSAGPYGDDIAGPWMTAEACLQVLVRDGLHWKDVHATDRATASDRPFPGVATAAMRRAARSLRRLRGGVRRS